MRRAVFMDARLDTGWLTFSRAKCFILNPGMKMTADGADSEICNAKTARKTFTQWVSVAFVTSVSESASIRG